MAAMRIPVGDDFQVSPAQLDAARQVVAGHAADADDLRGLLSALNLLGTKICTRCRIEKPLAEFHRASGGRKSRCAPCIAIVTPHYRSKPGR